MSDTPADYSMDESSMEKPEIIKQTEARSVREIIEQVKKEILIGDQEKVINIDYEKLDIEQLEELVMRIADKKIIKPRIVITLATKMIELILHSHGTTNLKVILIDPNCQALELRTYVNKGYNVRFEYHPITDNFTPNNIYYTKPPPNYLIEITEKDNILETTILELTGERFPNEQFVEYVKLQGQSVDSILYAKGSNIIKRNELFPLTKMIELTKLPINIIVCVMKGVTLPLEIATDNLKETLESILAIDLADPYSYAGNVQCKLCKQESLNPITDNKMELLVCPFCLAEYDFTNPTKTITFTKDNITNHLHQIRLLSANTNQILGLTPDQLILDEVTPEIIEINDSDNIIEILSVINAAEIVQRGLIPQTEPRVLSTGLIRRVMECYLYSNVFYNVGDTVRIRYRGDSFTGKITALTLRCIVGEMVKQELTILGIE